METGRRMSLLYKGGLGFWSIIQVQGSSHGCQPCFWYFGGWDHSALARA